MNTFNSILSFKKSQIEESLFTSLIAQNNKNVKSFQKQAINNSHISLSEAKRINKANSISIDEDSNIIPFITSLNKLPLQDKLNNLFASVSIKELALKDKSKFDLMIDYLILLVKQDSSDMLIEEFDVYSVRLVNLLLSFYKELGSLLKRGEISIENNSISAKTRILLKNVSKFNKLFSLFLKEFSKLNQAYNDKHKTITKQLPNLFKEYFKVIEELFKLKNNSNDSNILNNTILEMLRTSNSSLDIKLLEDFIKSYFIINMTLLEYWSSSCRSYEKVLKKIVMTTFLPNIYLIKDRILLKIISLNSILTINLSNNKSEKFNSILQEFHILNNNLDLLVEPKDLNYNKEEKNKHCEVLNLDIKILENSNCGVKDNTAKSDYNKIISYSNQIFNTYTEIFFYMTKRNQAFEFDFSLLLKELNIPSAINKLVCLNRSNLDKEVILIDGLSRNEYNMYISNKITNLLKFLESLINNFSNYLSFSCYKQILDIFSSIINNKLSLLDDIQLNIRFVSFFTSVFRKLDISFSDTFDLFLSKFIFSDVILKIVTAFNKKTKDNALLVMEVEAYLEFIYQISSSNILLYLSSNIKNQIISLTEILCLLIIKEDYLFVDSLSKSSFSNIWIVKFTNTIADLNISGYLNIISIISKILNELFKNNILNKNKKTKLDNQTHDSYSILTQYKLYFELTNNQISIFNYNRAIHLEKKQKLINNILEAYKNDNNNEKVEEENSNNAINWKNEILNFYKEDNACEYNDFIKEDIAVTNINTRKSEINEINKTNMIIEEDQTAPIIERFNYDSEDKDNKEEEEDNLLGNGYSQGTNEIIERKLSNEQFNPFSYYDHPSIRRPSQSSINKASAIANDFKSRINKSKQTVEISLLGNKRENTFLEKKSNNKNGNHHNEYVSLSANTKDNNNTSKCEYSITRKQSLALLEEATSYLVNSLNVIEEDNFINKDKNEAHNNYLDRLLLKELNKRKNKESEIEVPEFNF